MTKVVICAGGPADELTDIIRYSKQGDAVFIGADRGALYCIERAITPKLIIGDFDSLTESEWQWVSVVASKVERFEDEKNETDTELALMRAVEWQPKEIIITGVTGGRLDHYESVIRVMYRLQKQYPHIAFCIENKMNRIAFLAPGSHVIKKHHFKYLSLFAYEADIEDMTIRGVKYETTNEPLLLTSSRFTSNEIIKETAVIQFSTGMVMVIHSDEK